MSLTLYRRRLRTWNDDPQRRCYNGAHFSLASGWGPWEAQWTVPEERAARELEFWRELNAYAVRERGRDNTLSEYKILRADGTNWEEKTP